MVPASTGRSAQGRRRRERRHSPTMFIRYFFDISGRWPSWTELLESPGSRSAAPARGAEARGGTARPSGLGPPGGLL